MTHPLAPHLRAWFGQVDLRDDLDASAVSFLAVLVEMLDSLRPTLMDIGSSAVRQSEKRAGAEIELRHRDDDEATVWATVDADGAIIGWLTAHEHVFPGDAPSDRPWTTVAADAIAEILRGEYLVEDHYRGRRLVKTRVIDVAGPDGERVSETIGSLIGLIPWPGAKRVERRRVDFGARPQPVEGSG